MEERGNTLARFLFKKRIIDNQTAVVDNYFLKEYSAFDDKKREEEEETVWSMHHNRQYRLTFSSNMLV